MARALSIRKAIDFEPFRDLVHSLATMLIAADDFFGGQGGGDGTILASLVFEKR